MCSPSSVPVTASRPDLSTQLYRFLRSKVNYGVRGFFDYILPPLYWGNVTSGTKVTRLAIALLAVACRPAKGHSRANFCQSIDWSTAGIIRTHFTDESQHENRHKHDFSFGHACILINTCEPN